MNGKKYKVELKYADDQSDASQAAAAMEQLIKIDGLKLILSQPGDADQHGRRRPWPTSTRPST